MESTDTDFDPMLADIEKAIQDLKGGANGSLNLNSLASDPVNCAKVHMGLAFAINSLFYSTMRV